jgi:acetyl-CoA acyltransferase
VREALIVAAIRTPVGRRNGALAGVHPVELSGHVLAAVAERVGIDPGGVEDVVWGCVGQVGEQASNIGRLAVLAAGWPEHIPGTTVDRACGSSQQAIQFAAASIVAGMNDLVIAGGVESMSRVPMGSARRSGPGLPYGPRLRERYPAELGGEREFSQGWAAELIAERWRLSRRQLDDYGLRSHVRAAAATDAGGFTDEITPVPLDVPVTRDEGVRRGGTPETLAALPTPFRDGGVVTAGNASQISDGAAAVLLASREAADRLGLRPLARVHSAAVVGTDPVLMLTGPIPATAAVLRKAHLALDEIGTFEVNEAFASVVCAWLADTGADPTLVNPNGGAIAIGHPLGASGARLLTTMLHHMSINGIRYGLQTMCEGGGMANAMVVELFDRR